MVGELEYQTSLGQRLNTDMKVKKHLFNLGKLLYFYDGMKDNKP